jgi:hypothetical protein
MWPGTEEDTMKSMGLTMLAAALALPGASQAAGFSYSYLEAGYGLTEVDGDGGFGADGEGYRVAGSIGIGATAHAYVEYASASLEVDGTNIDADLETISIGLGYNYHISPRADVLGRVLYVDTDFEIDSQFLGVEGDDNGLGFQLHVRGLALERLEVEGGIDYVALSDEETSVVLAGRYLLTDALALGAEVEFGDDITTYGVTLRFNFGAPAAR